MIFRGAGYPVTPTFKVPPTPLQGHVEPLPDPTVANPGQYFSGQVNGYSNVLDGSQGQPPMADAICYFHSPDYYNCIEVDIETRKVGAGFCVPDKIALMLDDTIVFSFLSFEINKAITALATHEGLPNNGANATEYARLRREDWIKQPLKGAISAGIGDPSNSSNRADTQVWRIYGAKPFRYAYISYWMNLLDGYVPAGPNQCSFRVRCHYDPLLRVLRSV